jgi:isopentenyl-diphosphate delta-isomerase
MLTEETRKRKADHIRICLKEQAQARKATTGFEDIHFVHNALPEIDRQKIDLSTSLFGHKFAAPIIVGAMTGGTVEGERINAKIAEAVEKLGLGMGVGSQRAALEDAKLAKTFAVARKKAPTSFLVANIGGVQLVHGYGVKEVEKAVEMIDADALAVHLNALQEAVQPEGQTNFEGILAKISEIARGINKPIIVKETGAGIAAEEARKLEAAGVKAIDIGGSGGTSFAAVEYYRANRVRNGSQKSLSEAFWDWGIPTAASLVETTKSVRIPVIASGGVRDGIDVAKALSLNASLASVSQPILEASVNGAEEIERRLSLFMQELRDAMFCVGADGTEDLTKVPVVLTGRTAAWLRLRGFDIAGYARRGGETAEH